MKSVSPRRRAFVGAPTKPKNDVATPDVSHLEASNTEMLPLPLVEPGLKLEETLTTCGWHFVICATLSGFSL